MKSGQITQKQYSQALESADGFRGQAAIDADEFLNTPNKWHVAKFTLVMCLANFSALLSQYSGVCL